MKTQKWLKVYTNSDRSNNVVSYGLYCSCFSLYETTSNKPLLNLPCVYLSMYYERLSNL